MPINKTIKDMEVSKFIESPTRAGETAVEVSIDVLAGAVNLMVLLLTESRHDKFCKRVVGADIFYDFYVNGSICTTYRILITGVDYCVFEENFLEQLDGFKLLQLNGDAILYKGAC